MSDGPLAGLTVVELGSLIAGPFAGRILADFGARVIKVEPPEGDPLRQWGQAATAEDSYWSLAQSRNKELVAVDLRRPEGRALVRRLIARADALLENFRPGRLEAWGLDPAELQRENPGLIVVRVSGYGQTGPYRDRAGFGNIAESMGGLRAVTGTEDGPPLRVGVSLGDQVAALYAVIGLLLALHRRAQGHEAGETVDVALVEAVLSLTEAQVSEYVHAGVVPRRSGNRLGRAAPSGVFPTADGVWVAIGANADSVFRRLATAIGREAWLHDPELQTNAGRVRRVDELEAAIGAWTAARSSGEVVARLNEAGVPCGPVYTVREIAADPHFRSRDAIIEVPCPERGAPVTMLGVTPRLARSPGRVRRTGGPVGRDTIPVLREFLGLADDEIAGLLAAGVVAAPVAAGGGAHD
jgi:formyl-CoA transferase